MREVHQQDYRLHLLVWSIFITYEIVSVGLAYHVFGHPLTYTLHYLLAIAIFYMHADRVLPWAMRPGRSWWRLPLIILPEIGLYILLSHFADTLLSLLNIFPRQSAALTYPYALKTIYRCIYIMGFSTGFYFIKTYSRERKRTMELEKQRLNNILEQQAAERDLVIAQNAFLKAQINPHFLFNTLDFIYHKVLALSAETAEAIIVLSDMMRYATDADQMGEFILLADEINQVENLIFLYGIKKADGITLKVSAHQDAARLYFIPLVLLTLAENIFKHGDLSNPKHPASLRLFLEDNILHISSENLVAQRTVRSGGHGLANIASRLQFSYGTSAAFHHYLDEMNYFRTLITIPVSVLTGTAPVNASIQY